MASNKPASKSNGAGKKQAAEPRKLLVSGVSPDVGKATQFKKGQSGNPAGKVKGTLNLSTHIQNLLNDEEFEAWVQHPTKGFEQFKGAPMKAILKALAVKAINGDIKAFDMLAKYGYGTKVDLDLNIKEAPIPLLQGIAPAKLVIEEDTSDAGDTPADDSPKEDQ